MPRRRFIFFPVFLEKPHAIQWLGYAWKIKKYYHYGHKNAGSWKSVSYYFKTKEDAEKYVKDSCM